MSDRIGGFRQELEQNYDSSIIKDDAQQTQKTDGDSKDVKGGGLGAAPPPTNTGDAAPTGGVTPAQVAVMQCMMDAYNSNTNDINNKGSVCQQAAMQAAQLSAAQATLTAANLEVVPPDFWTKAGRGLEYSHTHTKEIQSQEEIALQQMAASGMSTTNVPEMEKLNSEYKEAEANGVVVTVVPDDSSIADSNNGSAAYITQSQQQALSSNDLYVPIGQRIISSNINDLVSAIKKVESELSSSNEYTMLQMQTDTQNQNQDSSMASGTLKSIGAAGSSVASDVD